MGRLIDAELLKRNFKWMLDGAIIAIIDGTPTAVIEHKPLQKPLTLEEACGSEEPCVFMELKEMHLLYAADVIREEYDKNVCYCSLLGGDSITKANEYNITWRCWATKPTDEEREAAKWES